MVDTGNLSPDQQRALSTLLFNGGEISEGTLFLEGLNRPRLTMQSLVRRGLVEIGEYLNEDEGYIIKVIDGYDIELIT